MKSKSTIRRHLKQLRKFIEESQDPIERRVAYAIEQGVRWGVLDTRGWAGLVDEAKIEADLMKKELGLVGSVYEYRRR